MINDILKRVVRWSIAFVCWVFLLSINIDGKTIFDRANKVLVQNSFVQMIDEELADLWGKIYSTAKITFSELSSEAQKKT